MEDRPPSSHVRTIYSHKQHGSQVPQVLHTQRIMVQPKKVENNTGRHGMTSSYVQSSGEARGRPRPQSADMMPKLLPRSSKLSSNVYAKEAESPIKGGFVPKIPQLSPNSFSQAWHKEKTERNGLNRSGDGAGRRHFDDTEYLEPVQEDEQTVHVKLNQPRKPPRKSVATHLEVKPTDLEPEVLAPEKPEVSISPPPLPPRAAKEVPEAVHEYPETDSTEPGSSSTSASTSSESLGDLQIKDRDVILDLFAVQNLDELDFNDFEENADGGKKFYEISAPKGLVQFELKQTEIQNNLEDFAKTPAAIGFTVKCRISRDKRGVDRNIFPNYYMHLELGDGHRVLILTARKRKKSATSNYLISVDPSDLTRYGDAYVGKIRSNLLGTQFTIYDGGNSPKNYNYQYVTAESNYREELGTIIYETNVLGFKGPRKMRVVVPAMRNESQRFEVRPEGIQDTISEQIKRDMLKGTMELRNKTPIWNEENQSYVLNFSGRVTHASVKNFQIVHDENVKYIILQFGRIDEDMFTLDFRYPFCPLQAFAIALSSFDHKLACE